MPAARFARMLAIVLLLVEGVSGASVGVTLLIGLAGRAGVNGAISIPIGILIYGLALVAAAIGWVLRRRWGWPLGTAAIVLGLAVLAVLLVLERGNDPVLVGGVVIWLISLGALLAGRSAAQA